MYQTQSVNYKDDCVIKGIDPNQCNLINKIIHDFKTVNYFLILLVITLFMLSNVLRSIRWQQLLEAGGDQVSFNNAFMCTMIGYFTNLGLPRMGEIIKAGFLARYEKIRIEKVLGTVVTDRALDVVMLSTMILFALFLEYDRIWNFIAKNQNLGEKFRVFSDHPGLIFIIVISVGVGCYFIVKSPRFRRSKVFTKLASLIKGFIQGIVSIKNLRNPGLFIFLTLSIWLLYYLMTFICFSAFEPTKHLSAVAALVTFVFGSLGIVFPSPGGMGSYHFLVTEALKLYDISPIDGFSYANIIFFSIQLFCNIFFGMLSLFFISLYNKK